MRNQLLKLKTCNSTKGERRIAELLKKHRIKFVAKAKIKGFEVDFLIGKTIIEVDGKVHLKSNVGRDTLLFKEGYIPLHISTYNRHNLTVEKDLLNIIKNNVRRN